jgi:hypothetical protein
MRIAVLGAGAVGARAVRQLVSTDAVTEVVVADRDEDRARQVAMSMADAGRVRSRPAGEGWWEGADVAILASAGGAHATVAEGLVAAGVSVVSVSADVDDVRDLLALDTRAREQGCAVVVGAGFSPGLSCLLAAHSASGFDVVDEVHVARTGTGGPACAADHLRAAKGEAMEWREGRWSAPPRGGGRQLCWFPDPVGALDCGRVAPADALVLVPAFPDVARVTSRSAAGVRNRVKTRLSEWRGRGGEGQLGAIRVEVRGRHGDHHDIAVLGAVDRPAVAAGSVAAVAALAAAGGRLARHGAGGLAELAPTLGLLAELARRGVKAAVFEGQAAIPATPGESV